MLTLSSLDFTDLYLRLDSDVGPDSTAFYASWNQTGGGILPVPDDLHDEINGLRAILRDIPGRDFSISLSAMRLRGSRQHIFGSGEWVALRRFPLQPPPLEHLGFPKEIRQIFRGWGRRTGLIVVGGSTRAGKTTTASACLTEWLKYYGRVAITIEDPVEYNIQGKVGEAGYCFQVEVARDEDWAEALKTALRWAPRYIFLGEVRTSTAARNLLRAATSGHLALCTVHGGSIEETLSALHQIARGELGDTAWSLLGDGLCAVIHQALIDGKPEVQILQADPNNMGDAVRQLVRSGKVYQLGTHISQQSALLGSEVRALAERSRDREGRVSRPREEPRLSRSEVQPEEKVSRVRKRVGFWPFGNG